MSARIVTDETFEQEVLKSELPVLVDFIAEWCGPCKAMAPALDQVADDLQGQVKIVKVDVDKSPTTTATYGIRSMPTLMLFKGGRQSAIHLGALVQKSKLREWIDREVGASAPASSRRTVEFKLSNGMQVVVLAKPGAEKVAYRIVYKVGTDDDPDGRAGTAMLVGTLMSRQAAVMGGTDWPYTTRSATSFQQRGKDTLSAAMATEANRMAALRVTEEDFAAALQEHIASQRRGASTSAEHFATLSRDEAVAFHQRFYGPDNAVLAIAGDVDLEDVKRLAEEAYGQIPSRGEIMRPARSQRPYPTASSRVVETDSSIPQGWLSRNYVVPTYTSAAPGEAEALEILATFLGRSGPSKRRLVNELNLAKKFMVSYSGRGNDKGSLSLIASLSDGTPEQLESVVDEIIHEIRANGVSELELARAKEVFAATQRVDDERMTSLADRYAWSLADGWTVAEVEGWPDAVAKATAQDVKRAAMTYLDPARAITNFRVPETPETASRGEPVA